MADVAPVVRKTGAPFKQPLLKRRREEDSESDDEPRQFRRVRIRCRQRTRRPISQAEAEFETLDPGKEIIKCVCGIRDYAPSAGSIRSWLIQCVECKVWQHRSCVGTANGNDPPKGFYCERCPHFPLSRLQAARTSPAKTFAVPEYLPLSEGSSALERPSTSSKLQPTNEVNIIKKGAIFVLGTGSSSEDDSSSDEHKTSASQSNLSHALERSTSWRHRRASSQSNLSSAFKRTEIKKTPSQSNLTFALKRSTRFK